MPPARRAVGMTGVLTSVGAPGACKDRRLDVAGTFVSRVIAASRLTTRSDTLKKEISRLLVNINISFV